MALDENKVIDVPDEAADDDEEDVDDEDDDNEEGESNDEKPAMPKANGASTTNGKKLDSIKEGATDEADSTGDAENSKVDKAGGSSKPPTGVDEVSSSNGNVVAAAAASNNDEHPSTSNGDVTASTSNGASATVDVDQEDDNEEGEGVSGSLQLAWEILEAAAKIFLRQGLSGLPYLADVQTELANIEFENGILDAAREDYGIIVCQLCQSFLRKSFFYFICRESSKDSRRTAHQESSCSGRAAL